MTYIFGVLIFLYLTFETANKTRPKKELRKGANEMIKARLTQSFLFLFFSFFSFGQNKNKIDFKCKKLVIIVPNKCFQFFLKITKYLDQNDEIDQYKIY